MFTILSSSFACINKLYSINTQTQAVLRIIELHSSKLADEMRRLPAYFENPGKAGNKPRTMCYLYPVSVLISFLATRKNIFKKLILLNNMFSKIHFAFREMLSLHHTSDVNTSARWIRLCQKSSSVKRQSASARHTQEKQNIPFSCACIRKLLYV